MPVTKDASGLRSGFNSAIGVLDGTVVGDAMVRDRGHHIARRGRVIKSSLILQRTTASIAIRIEAGGLE